MDFNSYGPEQLMKWQAGVRTSSMPAQEQQQPHPQQQQKRQQDHNHHHQQHIPLHFSIHPQHLPQHFHSSTAFLQHHPSCSPVIPATLQQTSNFDVSHHFLNSFSVTLNAPTLGAVKLSEEPVTCLNQGQSYDVKLRRQHSENLNYALYYKSNIRLMFHHRRLQHSEQEQFQSWLTSRPDQRLLDLDLPLAYNVLSAKEDPRTPNMTTITWAGQTEASVSVKINCISTEFTAKKHGGEKGVPFRLQVDTYAVLGEEEHSVQLLHRAYCLVKVFKPNGADRKNKTNLNKASKNIGSSEELFHPAYNITILTEVQPEETSLFSPVKWETSNLKNQHQSIKRSTQSLSSFSSQSNVFASSDDELSSHHSSIMDSSNTISILADIEEGVSAPKKLVTKMGSMSFNSDPQTQNVTREKAKILMDSIEKEAGLSYFTADSIAGRLQQSILNNTTHTNPEDGFVTLKMSNEDLLDFFRLTKFLEDIKANIRDQPVRTIYVSLKQFPENPTISTSKIIPSSVNSGSTSMTSTSRNKWNNKRHRDEGCLDEEEAEDDEAGKPNKKSKSESNQTDAVAATYRGIHLHSLTRNHLVREICQVFKISSPDVSNVYMTPTEGVNVIITDEEVKYIKNYSAFTLIIARVSGQAREKMNLFLAAS